MDEVIGVLRKEGAADSDGVFTIDALQAASKLQRFQLPGPYCYVLPMVASGVLGGASSVAYLRYRDHNLVELPGLAFDYQQCQQAFAGVCRDDSAGFFALAVQTAARLEGYEVAAVSWNGHGGASVRVRQGRFEVASLLNAPWPEERRRTRLTLKNRFPAGEMLDRCWRKLTGWPAARDPALEILKAYCSYSPIPIHSSSCSLTVERQGSWTLLGVVNGERVVRRLTPLSVVREVNLKAEVPFSGYLGWGPGGGDLLVIVDGLLYPVPLQLAGLGGAGFRGILWHQGLPRDLSLLQLVQGPALEELKDQVRVLVEQLRAQPACDSHSATV